MFLPVTCTLNQKDNFNLFNLEAWCCKIKETAIWEMRPGEQIIHSCLVAEPEGSTLLVTHVAI
jgi:hypothetical protein